MGVQVHKGSDLEWKQTINVKHAKFFRTITKQSYEYYLKGKPLDLFANDERQTRTFNAI